MTRNTNSFDKVVRPIFFCCEHRNRSVKELGLETMEPVFAEVN